MHFPDVSLDVSHGGKNIFSGSCAQICAKACGMRWTSPSKRWTTVSSQVAERLKKPANKGMSSRFGHEFCSKALVLHICNHQLHRAQHTMKGGECGDNTHADQRRTVCAVHVTQHRVPPHRLRALRAGLCGISDAHRRRLRAGLHHAPSLNASNIMVGR